MKKFNVLAFLTSACLFSGMPTAFASTLPPADLETVSIGIGLLGPGLSIDVPVAPKITAGVSAALPIFYPGTLYGTLRYSIYGSYQLIKEEKSNLSFAGILGVWGDRNFASSTYTNTLVALQLGFGIAYRFTEQIHSRVNFVAAFPASNYGIIAPAAGFELVYTPTKNLELSVGINGQGEILGARWKF